MALVYFHCSNIDAAGNLTQIREQAILAIRALIAAPNMEDWRGWVLHVNDDLGDERFVVPFSLVLCKPH